MIPLRVRQGPWFSIAAWSLALANVAVFAWLLSLPPALAEKTVAAWAFNPASFFAAWSFHGLATLVTSTFLHASWLHLLGNVLYLLVFGPVVETRIGWRGFLSLYFSCAVAAALVHSLLAPHPAPIIGASGAIAGVLGASLVFAPRAKVTALVPVVVVFFVAALPAPLFIGVWFALQAANAFGTVVSPANTTAVAWFAHLGGFAAGVLVAAPVVAASAIRNRRKR